MQKAIIKKKQDEVKSLVDKMKSAKTVLAIECQGLTVGKTTELRKRMRDAGCEMKVYKNNISRRAAELAGYKTFSECFVGPKALAYSNDDLIAPAKIVYEFSKENEVVKMFSGVIEGVESTSEQMYELATLPSYEGLLTMLAIGLNSPVTELGISLNLFQEQLEAK